MATIIKSDVVSTNNLGNILIDMLPKNNMSGFFDFSNNRYSIRDSNVSLSSIITTTRSSTAQGISKTGELVTYGVNSSRFTLVPSVKKYGLACGDSMKNYFLNSDAPVTQSITFAEGTDRRFFVLFRATGSGYITVSGSGISTFVLNGGEEKVIKVTATTNTINVAITGTLSYVQVSRVTTPYGADPSRPVTAGSITTKVQDINGFNQASMANLFTSNKATMFFKYTTFDGGDNLLTPHTNNTVEVISAAGNATLGGYVSWLQYVDGSNGKLFIRKQKSGILETSPIVDVPIYKTNIIAVRLSESNADVFMNGIFSKLPGASSGTTVQPYLYQLPFLSSLNNVYIAPNWIISNMVSYDKELSDSEIMDIYNIMR